MTDSELDALMRQVLLDALKHDWKNKLDRRTTFVPSKSYKRQVNAMLKNPLAWERKRAIPIWKKTAHQVAVILLVISIGFSTLLATSPTVRAAFLQWITEWYETHITYRYTGEDRVDTMAHYEITELPEGYVEAKSERVELSGQVDVVYRNEKTGQTIYLNYIQMDRGFVSDFELKKDSEIIPVEVNGLNGFFFEGIIGENEWNTVTWIDPDNALQFSIDACLSKSDILNIAESVSLVKMTK